MKTAKMMAMAMAVAMVLTAAMAQAGPTPALYVNMDNSEVSGTTVTAETGQVGAVIGDATMGAPGRIAEAAQFNGGGRVNFDGANLGLSTTWTYAFWFSTTWTGTSYAMQNQGGGQTAILYYGDTGRLMLWNMDIPDSDIYVPRDGAWTHVAWTYDGTDVRTYKDGAPDNTFNAPGAVHPNEWSWRIGGEDLGNGVAESRIDDFRIYDVALTAGEVAELIPTVVPEPAGLGLMGLALLALRKRRS